MKTKTIKTMCVLLIFLQVIIMVSPVFAVDIGNDVELYSIKKLDDISMNYYGQDVEAYFTVYKENEIEKPAYCVDYWHGGVRDDRSYSVNITGDYLESNQQNRMGVWKAIINGYPFKTFTQLGCANNYEAYAATKQAVFCMLYDRDINLYTYSGEAGERVYNAMKSIVEIARDDTTTIPNNNDIELKQTEWKIDKIDNKYLSKEITINCEVPIVKLDVTLEKDIPNGTLITDLNNKEITEFKKYKQFKILIPLESLTQESELALKIEAIVYSYKMYYGDSRSSTLQDYVLMTTEPKEISVDIKYPENKTKLIIEKQSSEGKVLPGVKFNVLDENKNIIFENVETNEDGIIEICYLLPGKYYIQEVKSIEGYIENTELIEVNIKLDEEKNVVVINEKIPEEPEQPEEPEEPEIPEVPETPEIPEIPEELPKLPRTGW